MSKQSQAKEAQEYQPKPEFPMCSNCLHFKSEFIQPYINDTFSNSYIKEINIRCGLGEFTVKKQGTCKLHVFNNASNN